MNGDIRNGTDFRVECACYVPGMFSLQRSGKLLFRDIPEIIMAVNIGTSANNRKPGEECSAKRFSGESWEKVFQAHTREYRRHYERVTLEVNTDENDSTPTDERLRLARDEHSDPGLAELYFNYGRYLLCASSATAELPANLQGKWNEDLNPPWECDYHHDINLQMNYWLAEPAGMQDYVEALLRHIERFVPHAEKAAKDLYGCAGVFSAPDRRVGQINAGVLLVRHMDRRRSLAGSAYVVALRIRA